ncbi:hypothetical protein [Polyangium sorediatum]|uniref:STAS/SEC14 domain-containing protein n=3 Tax=Polyangium TaxID=55 RepID=A0A4U1I5L6_9BACT|nr:hypothetical protein [Polyangium sorediatum]MDI1431165.1 hypothetical protein [Polyangium sorediatum]TKC88634.1 hypothetical protein E8A74_51500 [Polyangium fumosum]
MSAVRDESFAIIEEPDLAIAHYVGHVTGDDVRRLTAIRRRFSDGKPYVFLIIDLHRMVHLSSEARRVASETSGTPDDDVTIHGVAIVGARYQFRVLGSMLFRAIQLLRRTTGFPVRFLDTHTEARAWFEERRRELGLRRPGAVGPLDP